MLQDSRKDVADEIRSLKAVYAKLDPHPPSFESSGKA